MEAYNPNSTKAISEHYRDMDEWEISEARRWTPDRIRDYHAVLLEAKAQQANSETQRATYLERAQICRSDAEAIRRGEPTQLTIPPAF